MLKKIKDSLHQDLATNKLSVVTALVLNTLVLASNTRDDAFSEMFFWICVILEVLIILSIATMVYYKVKK